MDEVSITDAPTERTLYTDLTTDQQLALLESIRERRLAPLRVYEELQAKKKEVRDEKLAGKVGKLLAKVGKKLEAADKATADAEALIRDMKAVMLEMDT